MSQQVTADKKKKFLFVDQDPAAHRVMEELFADDESLRPVAARTFHEGVDLLNTGHFVAVVTDMQLGGDETGIDLCNCAHAADPELPVIICASETDVDCTIEALRAGANNFIRRPVEPEFIRSAIHKAVQLYLLTSEVTRLRQQINLWRPGLMVGESTAMLEVYDLLSRVGPLDVSTLIAGETGVGKEMVARAIHQQSKRAQGPFVAVNVAAIPETLLESELFGHLKGAFTGASHSADGLFRRAHGGTLFLDEIGDMGLPMQAKLLRALEERTVRPVGGEDEVAFDARLVAATHRDLEQEVEDGNFREDLYYRLNVVTVPIPPLRERGTDVLLLAQKFVDQFAARHERAIDGIHPDAAALLMDYRWPGNVRELRNSIERAVALSRTSQLVPEDFHPKIRGAGPPCAFDDEGRQVPLIDLKALERRHIYDMLELFDGNQSLAAEVLGVDRKTLYRKMKRFEADTNLLQPSTTAAQKEEPSQDNALDERTREGVEGEQQLSPPVKATPS